MLAFHDWAQSVAAGLDLQDGGRGGFTGVLSCFPVLPPFPTPVPLTVFPSALTEPDTRWGCSEGCRCRAGSYRR